MKKWFHIFTSIVLLIVLVGCSQTAPISKTTLSSISPAEGSNLGGQTVTLTGTNIFDATEGYEQSLAITVCGASLTGIKVTGVDKLAKSSSGRNVTVTVGETVTGTTSTVANPATATNDVILTRPDGTSVTLEDAYTCNDPPKITGAGTYTVREQAPQNGVIVTLQATDLDSTDFTYELVSGNTNDTFVLDADTGKLVIAKRINHDVTPNFELDVKVTDAKGLSSNKTLSIAVERDTKVYNWRLSSSWPTQDSLYVPINIVLQTTLKQQLSAQTNNQLNITITAPVTGLNTGVFDEVSAGTFEMAHTATSLYSSRNPAHDFFTSQPSGLTEEQHIRWLEAEGQALWNELNAPSNLIGFRAGTSGDKAVGWFRQPITGPAQLENLRWRMGGIASVVARSAGVYIPENSELASISPLFSALQNETIDAVKWSGPYADWQNKLHLSGAVYYPAPDWGQKNAALTLYVNLEKYNDLPVRLQEAIQEVSAITSTAMSDNYAILNAQGMTLIEDSGITILSFPQSVRDYLAIHSEAFQNARAAADPFYKKVYDSWKKFK